MKPTTPRATPAKTAILCTVAATVWYVQPIPTCSGGGSPSVDAAQPAATVQEIKLEEFKIVVREKKFPILDARPEIFHRFGHIPGALAMPRDEFNAYYKRHEAKLREFRLLPVFIYCQNANCEDAKLAAKALASEGFSHLVIYSGGWDEWTRNGLEVEKERPAASKI